MYTRRRHRQNLDSVTIGRYAGEESYTENTVSVGRKAGYLAQAQWAIAIGDRAGEETQGAGAIAIGDQAGRTSQGARSIAIGNRAGTSGQVESSIVISTNQAEITAAKKGLYIDPIRNFDDRDSVPLNGNILTHLYETKEVVTGLPKLPCYISDPATIEVGSMYFNTISNRVKVYNGTKWVIMFDENDLTAGITSGLFNALVAAAKGTAPIGAGGGTGGGGTGGGVIVPPGGGGGGGGGTGGGGYYNGVELIASGTNPTYWVYPVPTNQIYPTSVTRTSSETLIGIGETPVISITYTFNDGLVALEPMELTVIDHSRHFGDWDTVNLEPGDSSVTWTRPLEKMDFPRIIRAGMTSIVSKYYDPRLGPPRGILTSSIPEAQSSVEFRISSKSKPPEYNQTIECSLVAGNYGIPAIDTEGTATYDIFYNDNGDPSYIYRGGCYFKTYYTKKISGPNAGWCTPAYFVLQGMPPPSSSLDTGEIVYNSKQDCLASGGTLPPGAT